MALNETYHSLLIDYARGALDEAHSLLVATHIALSPNARRIVREYESIAGAMLQECCAPVSMCEDALSSVLARLDDCASEECKQAIEECMCADADIFPECLRAYIDTKAENLPWQKARAGLHMIEVQTTCRESVAEIVRIKGGSGLPERTAEVTLVRGDVIILNDEGPCKPMADRKEGCIALVVMQGGERTTPPQTDDLARRILNFLGK
jgi:putative transcriptional regulator